MSAKMSDMLKVNCSVRGRRSEGVRDARSSLCCVFTSSSAAGHIPELMVAAPPAERDALLHAVPVKLFLLLVLPRLA